MIVAGESSGDLHASRLVESIRAMPDGGEYSFFGAAGEKMRAVGVEPIVRSDDLAIVGLLEIGVALPRFYSAHRKLKAAARTRRPDAVVLVDFPDFNLKLLRPLYDLGIPTIYYISPQLWAWRRYRINTLKKYADLLLTILPFEQQWYEDRGFYRVEYVGNPTAGEVRSLIGKDEFRHKHGLNPSDDLIALLPGSRHKEIGRIFPVMLQAAHILSKKMAVSFVVAVNSARNYQYVESNVKKFGVGLELKIVEGETYEALNAADCAAITSGTATLEAGIIGTPMAIVYKSSGINYTLLRPLIDVDHFGLINLIAEERVAKELIQDDLTAVTLAAELERLLENEVNEAFRSRLALAVEKLGKGGASKRAAEAVIRIIEQKNV